MEFDRWSEAVYAATARLSRTAAGKTESAYGGAKPALELTEPAALAERTSRNLRAAMARIWQEMGAVRLNGLHVLGFMNGTAQLVSAGLSDGPLYRTWDTRSKYPDQLPPAEIPQAMERCAHALARRLPTGEPVETAAHLQRDLDRFIHPYTDGCGRTSRLLGAWVLLRHDLLPPVFEDQAAYYAAMNGPWEGWLAAYRERMPPA